VISRRSPTHDRHFGKRHPRRFNPLLCEDLTEQILGAAIEVHKTLGPGLLESAYEECLCHELQERDIAFARQVELPIVYKDVTISCGYRADMVVADRVLLELKSVDKVLPIHEAQLLTYLRLSGKRVGLLLNRSGRSPVCWTESGEVDGGKAGVNFNVPILTQGIVRRVL